MCNSGVAALMDRCLTLKHLDVRECSDVSFLTLDQAAARFGNMETEHTCEIVVSPGEQVTRVTCRFYSPIQIHLLLCVYYFDSELIFSAIFLESPSQEYCIPNNIFINSFLRSILQSFVNFYFLSLVYQLFVPPSPKYRWTSLVSRSFNLFLADTAITKYDQMDLPDGLSFFIGDDAKNAVYNYNYSDGKL